MNATAKLSGKRLRPPERLQLPGFSISALLVAVFVLILSSVPKDPLESGAWLAASPRRVIIAINLMPFAGVAFLWFVGVVRDRLGDAEDRLFATVFLGSSLLFLGVMFIAASVFGAIVVVNSARPEALANSTTYVLARALAYNLVNVYAIKMAGVFMVVTSTVALRTGFLARWIAFLGLAMALVLLFASQLFDWSFGIFPAWVLLISIYILIDNFQLSPRLGQN